MREKIIKEVVDLRLYPKRNKKVFKEVTIGDLHGNALKLAYFLIKENVLNISPSDYSKLVDIYTKLPGRITKEELDLFATIIKNAPIKNRSSLIRLLGDETCDRGNNDYLTLLIFEKLHTERVRYEILLSNHGLGFIEAYEFRDQFDYPTLPYPVSRSLHGIEILIKRGLITRDRVLDLANRVYKPALKLISYSINPKKKKITFYTHAPIGTEALEVSAQKFSVTYDDSSHEGHARTIEKINHRFQKYVNKNQVHTLYDPKNVAKKISFKPTKEDIIAAFIWSRDHKNINCPKKHLTQKIYYKWRFGHDSSGPPSKHRTSLDNDLGKSGWIPLKDQQGKPFYYGVRQIGAAYDSLKGEYKVIRSNEIQLNLSFENDLEETLPEQLDEPHSPQRILSGLSGRSKDEKQDAHEIEASSSHVYEAGDCTSIEVKPENKTADILFQPSARTVSATGEAKYLEKESDVYNQI